MTSSQTLPGFSVRRSDAIVDVSSPQPLAERVAVFGATLYAVAIVVEAIRSRAWIAAGLFAIIALAALYVAGGRARYKLDRDLLEVTFHFPGRARAVRIPTTDVIDFVATFGAVYAVLRTGNEVELPRGTMRSHEEARMLAEFLRERLDALREREAGYRTY